MTCNKQKKPQPPLPLQAQHAQLQSQPLHPHMECGVAGSPAPSPLLSAGAMGGAMQDSRARPERSPAKHGLHVNFTEKVEVKERREKFLTAKYGTHQMALIRKRLAVEMWLYDELQKLYESTENNKTDEVDVDIDELLDMDDDNQRRIHLQVCLLLLP
ncbi:Protein phosphatase 1 regulatory subunit 14B [Frankliniella fusca]|uniref:Protein phosphatase 1 regulatory subunit 14B n=1 Tax=Frankliniella fusca TaxID=407009 RepID=A0AAE1H4Y8_9NEOP|nr:Protein phosphatase 1 regulatory subunit 14B [Frankliniella fusca]